MRKLHRLAAAAVAVLMLVACGGEATEADTSRYAVHPATDYLEFAAYPTDGAHSAATAMREYTGADLRFRAATHAELDYVVGADQLAEMTEKLGSELLMAYQWRLENRENYSEVEQVSAKLEKLLGLPAYHVVHTFLDPGSAEPMVMESYWLCYDGALCVLDFLYAGQGTADAPETLGRILGGLDIPAGYSAAPAAYKNKALESYPAPEYDYEGENPLHISPGDAVRVDGKLYSTDSPNFLLYDNRGYCWLIHLSQNDIDGLRVYLDETFGEARGVPITAFGSFAGYVFDRDTLFGGSTAMQLDCEYFGTQEDGWSMQTQG